MVSAVEKTALDGQCAPGLCLILCSQELLVIIIISTLDRQRRIAGHVEKGIRIISIGIMIFRSASAVCQHGRNTFCKCQRTPRGPIHRDILPVQIELTGFFQCEIASPVCASHGLNRKSVRTDSFRIGNRMEKSIFIIFRFAASIFPEHPCSVGRKKKDTYNFRNQIALLCNHIIALLAVCSQVFQMHLALLSRLCVPDALGNDHLRISDFLNIALQDIQIPGHDVRLHCNGCVCRIDSGCLCRKRHPAATHGNGGDPCRSDGQPGLGHRI